VETLRGARWNTTRLLELADIFGTKATLAIVSGAIAEAQASS
jgi:hypothetical protein